ncbi:hypothetical protein E2P81_ATG01127 [Venturia nashicola]|nr:hypothetical protein E2P81_ATG01127 [Venturia nashicola]
MPSAERNGPVATWNHESAGEELRLPSDLTEQAQEGLMEVYFEDIERMDSYESDAEVSLEEQDEEVVAASYLVKRLNIGGAPYDMPWNTKRVGCRREA